MIMCFENIYINFRKFVRIDNKNVIDNNLYFCKLNWLWNVFVLCNMSFVICLEEDKNWNN